MRAIPSDLPIAFRDVRVCVNGAALVDGLTLDFLPGAPTALVGPNGSGKTTSLRLAMGLVAPTAGTVTWGGTEAGVPGRRAIVFQRPVMLRRSVADNLAYALAAAGVARGARPQRIAALLERVDLQDLAARPARRLSGGEQQRLAVARALARDPQVLFLDEPTASLDPASARRIEALMVAIARSGVKVIFASHDLGQVRRIAGDVRFLLRGRLCESAPVETFFNNPGTPEARAFIAGEIVV